MLRKDGLCWMVFTKIINVRYLFVNVKSSALIYVIFFLNNHVLKKNRKKSRFGKNYANNHVSDDSLKEEPSYLAPPPRALL